MAKKEPREPFKGGEIVFCKENKISGYGIVRAENGGVADVFFKQEGEPWQLYKFWVKKVKLIGSDCLEYFKELYQPEDDKDL